jgi:recombination protein RecR
MRLLPPALDKLVTLLARLPGVGERSATRMALFLLSEPGGYAEALSQALADVTRRVRTCAECHLPADQERCPVCGDPGRDRTMICVVQAIQDVLAFEATGAYRGLYHVLHGALSPLKGVGPGELRLANLMARLDAGAEEVVLATATDVEGEATALYLARLLVPTGVKVTRIATGIPMGGSLEYLDAKTLGRALAARAVIA